VAYESEIEPKSEGRSEQRISYRFLHEAKGREKALGIDMRFEICYCVCEKKFLKEFPFAENFSIMFFSNKVNRKVGDSVW